MTAIWRPFNKFCRPRPRRYITQTKAHEVMTLWLAGDWGANQIAQNLNLDLEQVCTIIELDPRSGVSPAKRGWLGSQSNAKFDKGNSAQL